MAVCPPPNKEDHQQLLAWAARRPALSSALRELVHFTNHQNAPTPSGDASGKSTTATFQDWVSVRLGTRSPYVWQLQWARLAGPYVLFFESDKPNASMLRAVYIPGTTPVPLQTSHPDACKRDNVLFLESLFGACFSSEGNASGAKEAEEEAPLQWHTVLVDQRRTFLYFESKDAVYRWKLKIAQVGSTRSEFSGVRFGHPYAVDHLTRINETPNSRPGLARPGPRVPASEVPENFGAHLFNQEILRWLRSQGLTDEDLSKHSPLEWTQMVKVTEQLSTSQKVGAQFRKMDPKKRVTLNDLTAKESMDQLYTDLVLIDQGMQGKVYRAVTRATKQPVAVKKVLLKNESSELPPLINEIHVLSSCRHPNIVQLLSCHQLGKEISIVMEYMCGGKLTDILDEEEGLGVILSEKEIATITYEVVAGLLYLHSNGIMHRDIKSDNILVNDKGEIKLGDFGFATNLLSTSGALSSRKTLVGTPYWMAPEITKGQEYNFKADNWSLGILFLELCDNLPPWMGMNPIKALSKISLSPPPTISRKTRPLSSLAADFAKFVLVKDPIKRPTIEEINAHPFLAASNRLTNHSSLKSYVEKLLAKKGRKK